MTFAKLLVFAAAVAILAATTTAGSRADDPEDKKPSRLGRGAKGGGVAALPNCEGATIPVAAYKAIPAQCRKCTSKDLTARFEAGPRTGAAMYPQCMPTSPTTSGSAKKPTATSGSAKKPTATSGSAKRAIRVAKRVADRRAKRAAMRKERKIAEKKERVKQAKVDRKEKRVEQAKADRKAGRKADRKDDRKEKRVEQAKAARVAARQAEKAWKGYGYTLVNSGTCGDAGAEIVTTVAECAYASNFRSAGNSYQQGANVGTEYWHFGRPLNCMYGGSTYTWHDPDSIHPSLGDHPNALCGSGSDGSGTPYACICRVKLPPPHDGPPEPLSNHVVYNGHVYGTLANAAVDGPNGVGVGLCQEEYLPVPKGCRLAPNTEEILNNVVKGHTWSTAYLLLPDAEIGSLVGSIQYHTETAHQTGSKGTLARDGANLYKPSTGCMQILYECVASDPTPSPTADPTPSPTANPTPPPTVNCAPYPSSAYDKRGTGSRTSVGDSCGRKVLTKWCGAGLWCDKSANECIRAIAGC